MEKKISIQRVSVAIMFVTLLSKIIGFGRELLFSYFFGATNLADAYVFSLTISTIVFGFIGTGITTSFIPMYTKVRENEGIDGANKFTSNLLTIYIFISITIILFLWPNTGLIVDFLAGGFDPETSKLAADFCKYSILTVLATGVLSILSGVLQINNNYLMPASVGLPLNVVLIISFVIAAKTQNWVLGLGNLCAVYIEVAYLLPWLKKTTFRWHFKLDLKSKYLKEIFKLAIPIIISASVNQINVLIDKSLASGTEGGISTLNYAHTIISIINDVVIASFITTMYPRISKAFADKKLSEAMNIFKETLSVLMMILIPSMIGLSLCAEPVIAFFFGRGAFTHDDVIACSGILICYAFGIPFVGIRQLLIRMFYAQQDTKTPVKNASVAIGINIVLNFPLMKMMGIKGLSLATSISAVISVLLLWRAMKKKIELTIDVRTLKEIAKILISSLSMGIITYISLNIIERFGNVYLTIFVTIFVSMVAYFGLLLVFKVESIKKILKRDK